MNCASNSDHLNREWEQAWIHYRHLESMRTNYLGFFFTVLLASIGLSLGLLKDVKVDDRSTIMFGLYILTEILFTITLGLFIAIIKIGYVLKRYDKIMKYVREKSGFKSSEELPFDLSDMNADYLLNAKVYSVQKIAELIIGISSLVLFLILAVGAAYIIFGFSLKFNIWHKILSGFMMIYSLVFMIFVLLPFAKKYLTKKKK